ncbi:hypothetical protein Taro_025727 [Colocasia esculenta]|uniref:Myb/SANT-like domain-containing protein n=1 Tax=Colocasia esculenta TaxID=4460 RepID=A0A843VAZ2_COLES|nr:hypothetical protein [Colocasia esculenta]
MTRLPPAKSPPSLPSPTCYLRHRRRGLLSAIAPRSCYLRPSQTRLAPAFSAVVPRTCYLPPSQTRLPPRTGPPSLPSCFRPPFQKNRTGPLSTGKGRSPNWTLRQDRILLDLLIDVHHKTYGSQGTFKAHVFQDILHQFNTTANVIKDKDSLKYRWRNIKKVYHLYEQLRTRSGWGWDGERNLPVPPDEESIQAAIATNSEYKNYIDKPFSYKRQLDILCGKTTVRGSHFMGSTQEVDVEATRSFGDDDSVDREQFNAMGLESSQFHSMDGDNFNPFDFPSSSQLNPPSRSVGEKTPTNIHPVEDEATSPTRRRNDHASTVSRKRKSKKSFDPNLPSQYCMLNNERINMFNPLATGFKGRTLPLHNDLVKLFSGKWNGEALMQIFPPSIVKMIEKWPTLNCSTADERIWLPDEYGFFSTHGAYKWIREGENKNCKENQSIWKKIWKWRTQNRIKVLLWKVAWKRLPTKLAQWHRRHWVCTGTSHSHALISCKIARNIWKNVALYLGWPSQPASLSNLWGRVEYLKEKNLYYIYTKVVVARTFDAIWRVRNDSLFWGEKARNYTTMQSVITSTGSFIKANWDVYGRWGVSNDSQVQNKSQKKAKNIYISVMSSKSENGLSKIKRSRNRHIPGVFELKVPPEDFFNAPE